MNDRIIKVLAQSRVRFEAACGRTMTYEEAEAIVREEEANRAPVKDEVWVDITTGKKHKANY